MIQPLFSGKERAFEAVCDILPCQTIHIYLKIYFIPIKNHSSNHMWSNHKKILLVVWIPASFMPQLSQSQYCENEMELKANLKLVAVANIHYVMARHRLES